MTVIEIANKALTALVIKGTVTALAVVGECEISVEKPVPLPCCFNNKSKQDTELLNCCIKKDDDTSKSGIVASHFKLQLAPKYTTLPKPMARRAQAARACGNGFVRHSDTTVMAAADVHMLRKYFIDGCHCETRFPFSREWD